MSKDKYTEEEYFPYSHWIDNLEKKVSKDVQPEEIAWQRKIFINAIGRYYSVKRTQRNADELVAKANQVWMHDRMWKSNVHRHPMKRMQELHAPGQERRIARVGAHRKSNRNQISFFCRYMIVKKN